MADTELLELEAWHLLFDRLCNRAGYFDDAALAAAYCTHVGKEGQAQYDAVLRSFNNWRSGRHLPRAGNLRILEELLGVGKDKALHTRWQELHRMAASEKPIRTANSSQAETAAAASSLSTPFMSHWIGSLLSIFAEPRVPRWSTSQVSVGATLLFCCGVALGGSVTASNWRPWAGPADNAPIIPFRPNITMKVGESRPIYAVRGDCGKLPSDWQEMLPDLPSVKTGTLSDGGLARRHSKFCQGLTPARAIHFTATLAGIEEFEIQGDFFKMTVLE